MKGAIISTTMGHEKATAQSISTLRGVYLPLDHPTGIQVVDRSGGDRSLLRVLGFRVLMSRFKALLDTFHGVRLEADPVNGDMLGSAYQYPLREFVEAAGKAGEFFTPRHMVHLLLKILDQKPGETITDPAWAFRRHAR